MRRTRRPEVAAELGAEVFAAALGSAPRYRPAGPTAAGWLFKIAQNALYKSARADRRSRHVRCLGESLDWSSLRRGRTL